MPQPPLGALGVGLLSMVANFTIGKDKYKDVEAEIRKTLSSSEKLRGRLQKLIDEDIAAYQKVSSAYKMPRQTDEDKKARTEAIQVALKDAMAVPLAACRTLFEAMKLCRPLLEKGNRNLVSDVGVAAQLIASAFESALLNVEINLSAIRDRDLADEISKELSAKEKQIQIIKENIVKQVKRKI